MSRRSRVLLLVAAVALVAAAATGWWWWTRRPERPTDPLERPPGVVRVEWVAPRTARVLVGGLDAGTLERDERGHFTGRAQARLTVLSRRFVGRRVELLRDPRVDLELAAYVQRLLLFGGAASCAIIDAPPPR